MADQDDLSISRRSAHPIPELVDLVTPEPDGADGLDPISVDLRGNTVKLYELPGGQLLRTIRHSAAVDAVAFAAAGHDLVSGAIDGSLLVTRDGREPITLPVFPGGIDAAGFLPDGRVVAADARGRLRIYDTDHGAVLADLAVATRVRLLRPSPDGLRLITVPSFTGKAAPPATARASFSRRVVTKLAGRGMLRHPRACP